MKRFVLAIIVLLSLAACDTTNKITEVARAPIGSQALSDARNTIYTIKVGYYVTLNAAVVYAELPSCSRKPFPCSDDGLVKYVASLQPKVAAAINSAEKVVLSANPDMKTVDAAVAAARTSYEIFLSATNFSKGR